MTRSPETTRRRVLTVIRWPLGGIRTYLLYYYPVLMRAGYRFTLVGPADDAFHRLCGELEEWEGIEFVEAPTINDKCSLRSAVRSVLRQHRHDLIHSQGLTAGTEAVLANLGFGVPHVITSHDVLRPAQFAGPGGRLKLALLRWLIRRAHVLNTVSHDAAQNHRQYLGEFGRRGCRLETIVNGIEVGRFDRMPEIDVAALRRQWQMPPEGFLLGFLGRFMEQKGFLLLVDALQQAIERPGNERLHLLAVGSGDYVREYRAVVDASPALTGRITFLDYTPEILPILRAIDLLVMPSLWEACPLLPMEAMCAGVPVLGSDCIGLREVLAETPSIMVPSGDVAALAQALEQAAKSSGKEQSYAYAPTARRRFDAQVGARQLLALFDQFAR